jgi:hypothetical protein
MEKTVTDKTKEPTVAEKLMESSFQELCTSDGPATPGESSQQSTETIESIARLMNSASAKFDLLPISTDKLLRALSSVVYARWIAEEAQKNHPDRRGVLYYYNHHLYHGLDLKPIEAVIQYLTENPRLQRIPPHPDEVEYALAYLSRLLKSDRLRINKSDDGIEVTYRVLEDSRR